MVLRISHQTPATAEACAAIARAGAQVFEIDLRAIDGRIYATHFLPVVPGLTWVERDGWRFRPRPRTVTAESMAAVVARLPPDCEVLLDLKDDRGPGAGVLAELVLRSDLPVDRVYVSSKSWSQLAPLRDAGLRTWRTVDTGLALRRLLRDRDPVAHHGATVRHQLLNRRTIAAIREATPLIVAWTVNQEVRARYLADQGIDGITSDSLRVLRAMAAGAPGAPETTDGQPPAS